MTSLLCLALSHSLPLGWMGDGTPHREGCSKRIRKHCLPSSAWLTLFLVVPPPILSRPQAKGHSRTHSINHTHSLPTSTPKGWWSLTTIGCVLTLFLYFYAAKSRRTPLLFNPPLSSRPFPLFICFLGRLVCHLFSSSLNHSYCILPFI